MNSPITELEGLRVVVDRVVHMPQLDAPPERPHPFVYFITIHNDSDETVTTRRSLFLQQLPHDRHG